MENDQFLMQHFLLRFNSCILFKFNFLEKYSENGNKNRLGIELKNKIIINCLKEE